ncbi:hypothetical protein BG11_5834 (plasmid) [Bacillus cereus]|nr:hypothetical protein BG11_5834 [Bacillus cereus]
MTASAVAKYKIIPITFVILGFISFIFWINSPTLVSALTNPAANSPHISTKGCRASAQTSLNFSIAIPRGLSESCNSFIFCSAAFLVRVNSSATASLVKLIFSLQRATY